MRTLFSTTQRLAKREITKAVSNYQLKDKYEYSLNINPTGVDRVVVNDYLPVSDIPFSSFELPKDTMTDLPVQGVFSIVGAHQDDKIMVPLFYNRLFFTIVFIPENTQKYRPLESVFQINIEGQEIKLGFSGTRGKWYL